MLHLTGLPIAPDQASLTDIQRRFLAAAIPPALDHLYGNRPGQPTGSAPGPSSTSVRERHRQRTQEVGR